METISLILITFDWLGSVEFDPAWGDGDCVGAAALALLPDVDIMRLSLRGGWPSVFVVVR